MSRLIDADKLIQDITNTINEWIKEMPDGEYLKGNVNFAEMAKEIVRNQPTAYDVDKAVEDLEEQISKHDLLFNKYVKDKDKSDSWSISELNKIRGLLEAIDIVKAGGIDE